MTCKAIKNSQVPPCSAECRTSDGEITWFWSHLEATPVETEHEPENPLKNSLFCWALTKGHSCQSMVLKYSSASTVGKSFLNPIVTLPLTDTFLTRCDPFVCQKRSWAITLSVLFGFLSVQIFPTDSGRMEPPHVGCYATTG